MGRSTTHTRNAWQAMLAMLVLALVPAVLEAAGIGFRNDTPHPIYVQGSSLVNGKVQRGPLLYLKPGETAYDVNLMKGPRTITVCNPANQKMFHDVRPFEG